MSKVLNHYWNGNVLWMEKEGTQINVEIHIGLEGFYLYFDNHLFNPQGVVDMVLEVLERGPMDLSTHGGIVESAINRRINEVTEESISTHHKIVYTELLKDLIGFKKVLGNTYNKDTDWRIMEFSKLPMDELKEVRSMFGIPTGYSNKIPQAVVNLDKVKNRFWRIHMLVFYRGRNLYANDGSSIDTSSLYT